MSDIQGAPVGAPARIHDAIQKGDASLIAEILAKRPEAVHAIGPTVSLPDYGFDPGHEVCAAPLDGG